jgi:CubicO group peptidase (beta-lactamase class C family)
MSSTSPVTASLFILVVLLLWSFPVSAQPSDELSRAIAPLIRKQLQARDIAGAVIAVVNGDAPVYVQAFGNADVTTARPMTVETRLRLASMSKVFTTIAVMRLVDTGRLDLDRDINAYLNFRIPPAANGKATTLRRLLSHQDGFEDTVIGIASLDGTRQALGHYLPSHPPARRPSPDGIAYSNYGFALAAYVVERASGQTFEDYLERFVFAPLEMTGTTAHQPLPRAWLPLTSSGYDRGSSPPTTRSMAALTVHEAGSTGVVSTAQDMARFIAVLLDPPQDFLSARAVAAMRTPQVQTPNGFIGLGLYSPLATGGNAFIGHDGGSGGLHGSIALAPASRFAMFAFYNSSGRPQLDTPEGELLRALSERYAGPGKRRVGQAPGNVSGVYEPVRRVHSNLFALDALIGQLRVRQEPGAVVVNLPFIPFGGRRLLETSPGVFTDSAMEVSFAPSTTGMRAQLGAPVASYRRVRWWTSAQTVVPLMLVSLVVTAISSVRFAWRRLRGRSSSCVPGRLSLVLTCGAILGAAGLITGGRVAAVTASPTLTMLLSAIYAAAWSGVGLAGVALVQCLHRSRIAWKDVVVAFLAVAMSIVCIVWRIAGTSLP